MQSRPPSKLMTLAWPVALCAIGAVAVAWGAGGVSSRHRPAAARAAAGPTHTAPARLPRVRPTIPAPTRPSLSMRPPAPAYGGPEPQHTGLQFELIATVVTKDPAYSSAIIVDQTRRSAAYFVGDGLPGAGKIVRIAPRYVDFERGGAAGSRERLDFAGATELTPPHPPGLVPAPPRRRSTNDPLQAEMDTALKQTSPTSWEISRTFVDHVLADPMMLMRSARIRPGKEGLSVFGVRPDGAAERVGLKNGDKIVAINGNELAGAGVDQLLQLYAKLKTTEHLTVRVTRGGQQVNLDYSVR
jgi:general secretion pathway protein C